MWIYKEPTILELMTLPVQMSSYTLGLTRLIIGVDVDIQRKKEGKDQESIQSSTTPDPGTKSQLYWNL